MIFITFFFSLISCGQFIPPVTQESFLLFKVNITGLSKLVTTVPRVVAFIHDKNSPVSQAAHQKLVDSISLFSDELIFVEIPIENATELVQPLGVSAPHLFLYTNSTLWLHCRFPFSETAYLYLMNLFADGQRTPVCDIQELYGSLGTSYYSLVYPGNKNIDAANLHRFASSKIGFVDMIPYSTKSAAKLGLENGKFYLFRIEDFNLVQINETIEGIIEKTTPVFKRFSANDFLVQDKLIFGVVIDRLTNLVADILENVGKNYENLTIGFIDKSLHDFINISLGGIINSTPTIILYNCTSHKYYDIPNEIIEMLKQNDVNVISKIMQYLSNLPEPVSPSEPIPTTNPYNFTKLVGLTHDKFMNDPEYDTVILYVSQESPVSARFIRLVNETSTLLKDKNITNIKFGIINTTLNSASFPDLPVLPYIVLFPATNKTDRRIYFGQSEKNDFLRYLKRHTSVPIDMDLPCSTIDYQRELIQIYLIVNSLRGDDITQAIARLYEISKELNINIDDFNQALKDDVNI